MKTKHEIQKQLHQARMDLLAAEKTTIGKGTWSRTKGYVEALEWVLKEE